VLTVDRQQPAPSINSVPNCYSHNRQLKASGDPFSKNFEDFCLQCLVKDPNLRPSIQSLAKHPFITAEDEGVGREALLELLSSIQRTDRVEEIKNDDVVQSNKAERLDQNEPNGAVRASSKRTRTNTPY
jgi:serine/threonine protein kinase